jgi:hypothetical protein
MGDFDEMRRLIEEDLITDLVVGFTHAYSFSRKLRSAYTGNAILLRIGTSTTFPIGFANNEINESTMVGVSLGGNAYVSTVYDQIGSLNMSRLGLSNEPKIVDAGTVIKVNGKVYSQFDGSNDYLFSSTGTPITDKDCTVFLVFESQSGATAKGIFEERETTSGLDAERVVLYTDTDASAPHYAVNYSPDGTTNLINFSSAQPASTKRVFILKKIGTTVSFYDETNTLIGSITSADTFSLNTYISIGRQLNGNLYFGGKIAELLINNTALSPTDQTTVLNNIKTYYGIS